MIENPHQPQPETTLANLVTTELSLHDPLVTEELKTELQQPADQIIELIKTWQGVPSIDSQNQKAPIGSLNHWLTTIYPYFEYSSSKVPPAPLVLGNRQREYLILTPLHDMLRVAETHRFAPESKSELLEQLNRLRSNVERGLGSEQTWLALTDSQITLDMLRDKKAQILSLIAQTKSAIENRPLLKPISSHDLTTSIIQMTREKLASAPPNSRAEIKQQLRTEVGVLYESQADAALAAFNQIWQHLEHTPPGQEIKLPEAEIQATFLHHGCMIPLREVGILQSLTEVAACHNDTTRYLLQAGFDLESEHPTGPVSGVFNEALTEIRNQDQTGPRLNFEASNRSLQQVKLDLTPPLTGLNFIVPNESLFKLLTGAEGSVGYFSGFIRFNLKDEKVLLAVTVTIADTNASETNRTIDHEVEHAFQALLETIPKPKDIPWNPFSDQSNLDEPRKQWQNFLVTELDREARKEIQAHVRESWPLSELTDRINHDYYSEREMADWITAEISDRTKSNGQVNRDQAAQYLQDAKTALAALRPVVADLVDTADFLTIIQQKNHQPNPRAIASLLNFMSTTQQLTLNHYLTLTTTIQHELADRQAVENYQQTFEKFANQPDLDPRPIEAVLPTIWQQVIADINNQADGSFKLALKLIDKQVVFKKYLTSDTVNRLTSLLRRGAAINLTRTDQLKIFTSSRV